MSFSSKFGTFVYLTITLLFLNGVLNIDHRVTAGEKWLHVNFAHHNSFMVQIELIKNHKTEINLVGVLRASFSCESFRGTLEKYTY